MSRDANVKPLSWEIENSHLFHSYLEEIAFDAHDNC